MKYAYWHFSTKKQGTQVIRQHASRALLCHLIMCPVPKNPPNTRNHVLLIPRHSLIIFPQEIIPYFHPL